LTWGLKLLQEFGGNAEISLSEAIQSCGQIDQASGSRTVQQTQSSRQFKFSLSSCLTSQILVQEKEVCVKAFCEQNRVTLSRVQVFQQRISTLKRLDSKPAWRIDQPVLNLFRSCRRTQLIKDCLWNKDAVKQGRQDTVYNQ